MSRAVAVMNPKGGVGKTTTALNLAAMMALMGHRTLIADLDPDGATGLGLGFDSTMLEAGILDIFEGTLTPRQVIRPSAIDRLDFVPSRIRSADEAKRLFDLADDTSVLRRLVKAAKAEYEWIVLDCPPSLGTMTVDALVAVDGAIIPVQCGYFAMKSLGKLLRLVRLVNDRANSRLDIDGVLVTMYDGRTSSSHRVYREIRESFGDLVFETYIPQNARLNEATFHGQPAVVFDPHCSGSRAYRRLALEMLSRDRGVQ